MAEKKKKKAKAEANEAKTSKKAATKAKKKVAPIPPGYTTITPTFNQQDAAATIAFIKAAFGGKVRMKMEGPGRKIMHAEIAIGDSVLMISDSVMEPARVGSVFLYVPDVDKTTAKAVKAGAKVLMAPADQFWGDRHARVVDPFGNLWAIATHVEDVDPKDMKKRMKAAEKAMAAGG